MGENFFPVPLSLWSHVSFCITGNHPISLGWKQRKSKEELGQALLEASENGEKEELKQLLAAEAPVDARDLVRRMHGRVNGQSA